MASSDSDKPTPGATANKQGKVLESIIEPVFQNHGFKIVSFTDWSKAPEKYGEELLLKNVPYTSIYGHKGRTEFLLRSEKHGLNVRIECKWQQKSGSVDEKYPYLLLNCVEAMQEKDIMIVYGGNGMKPGAIAWLKMAAETNRYEMNDEQKNITVLSIDEFIIWANRTLM